MSDTDASTDESQSRTYYDVLGVPTSADRDSVRIAYRTRMVELQSDVWRGSENDRRLEAARVNDAWNTLSDPFQRERYDAELESGFGARVPAAPGDRPTRAKGRQVGPTLVKPFVVGSGPVPPTEKAFLTNRVNALFLDIMSCFFFYVLFTLGLGVILGPQPKTATPPAWVQPVGAAFIAVLLVAIFVLPTVRSGQTLGQRWFGVRVVRREDGELPGLTRTLYRYGPLVILVVTGIVLLPPLVFVPFFMGLSFLVTKTKRGLPDAAAKTVVVDAEPRPPRLRRRRPVTP